MTPAQNPVKPQPIWFLVLFALAFGAGAIAYVPLLTVLLPLKVTELMQGEDVAALASVTFFGAVIASLANIAFGMLSDRTSRRMPWVLVGLILSSGLLVTIGQARSMGELIILVMFWQSALNMMLSPLLAWGGDCVPDSQKGLLGGFLAFAPAMGAIAGSVVTLEVLVPVASRYWAVAAAVVILILPVLALGRDQARKELLTPQRDRSSGKEGNGALNSIVLRMWLARFMIQIAEAGLFAFLLFWLRSIIADFHENSAANVFSLVLIVSVPFSLWLGRWSDRRARPISPLVAMAGLAAVALCIMTFANGLNSAITGYVVFGIGATIFLSLHTGQTLRVLPKPQHRGRDLGIFNLTNTVPSMVMPWLTLTLVPSFGYAALFGFFAILAAIAGGLLASVPKTAASS